MRTDGDLWKLFYTHAHAKGLHSISSGWVKGHTTLEDVAADRVTLQNHVGNSRADTLATDGVSSHGQGIMQLGHVYASRQLVLKRIIIAIFELFEAVFDAENARKKLERTIIPGVAPSSSQISTSSPPSY